MWQTADNSTEMVSDRGDLTYEIDKKKLKCKDLKGKCNVYDVKISII